MVRECASKKLFAPAAGPNQEGFATRGARKIMNRKISRRNPKPEIMTKKNINRALPYL